jgi:hypothetical protein
VLEEDNQRGTTTMAPRLLTWLLSFTSTADRSGVLPGLRVLTGRPAQAAIGTLAGGGHYRTRPSPRFGAGSGA